MLSADCYIYLVRRNLRKVTKKQIYRNMMQSMTIYGVEVWNGNKNNISIDMDCLKKNCKKSKLKRIRKPEIIGKMRVVSVVIAEVHKRQKVQKVIFGEV